MVKHINDQAKELAKQKKQENGRRYYAKNREKVLEHKRAYYKKNREKVLERQGAYYTKNREKVLECQRAYQAKNRPAINLSRRLKIPIAEIRDLSLAEAIKLRHKI